MRIKSFLILLVYKTITLFLAPLAVIFISYKRRKDPKYGFRILELIGIYFGKGYKKSVWFHAASFGEVNALKPFIVEFNKQHPEQNIVLTTMTTTGAQAGSSLRDVNLRYVPLDSSLGLRAFFCKFHPQLLIIIDTELWPNMIDIAHSKNCPVIIINARMQEKNCNAYLKHEDLVKDLIGKRLSKVLCVAYSDKERFEKIGVNPHNIAVTGNLKYDLVPREGLYKNAKCIKEKILGNRVFGAISIHEGEEITILNAFLKAKLSRSKIKMVIVPRHLAIVKNITSFLDKNNCSYSRKSELLNISDFSAEVLIGDTIGEIESYLGLCDVVFMGGSFISTGGHNPLEPAFFSLPLITGPDYHNFAELFDKLIECGGCFLATDEYSLTKIMLKLLFDNELKISTGVKALDIQQQGRGAIQRSMNYINDFLK